MTKLYAVYGMYSHDDKLYSTFPWIICTSLKEAVEKCPCLNHETQYVPVVREYKEGYVTGQSAPQWLIKDGKIYHSLTEGIMEILGYHGIQHYNNSFSVLVTEHGLIQAPFPKETDPCE